MFLLSWATALIHAADLLFKHESKVRLAEVYAGMQVKVRRE